MISRSRATLATVQDIYLHFILQAVVRGILLVAFVFLDIWMWSLTHFFESQSRDIDQRYAIAIFVYLILCTIRHGTKFLKLSLPCIFPKSEERKKDEPRSPTRCLLGSILRVIVSIIIAVRIWTWFRQFRSSEDEKNTIYTAVYGTMLGFNVFIQLLRIVARLIGCCSTAAGPQ